MKIFYTTEEFRYKGKTCPGIPFLCEDDMELSADASDYLLWTALENVNTASPATWTSHAETLYDYFSWLRANRLDWDSRPVKNKNGEELTTIAIYRNWSLELIDGNTGLPRVQPSTVRKRLTHLMSFYRWAKQRGRIDFLPWENISRTVREAHPSIYRHTRPAQVVIKDNLRPKSIKKAIPVLSIDQCRDLVRACGTETLCSMTKLMLQTGLRNEECRTFPRVYVFDPSALGRGKRVPINLNPSDMEIKGDRPRRVFVTWQLMRELFDYLNFGEGVERARIFRGRRATASSLVFLNQNGEPWSEKGLNNAYRKLWVPGKGTPPRLVFRVTPHMLRRTFATLELYAESKKRNLGQALAWVRDRLGHSSIATTNVYVHCLDLIGETELNLYQAEIDSMGAENAKWEGRRTTP